MGPITRDWIADQVHKQLYNPVNIGIDVGQIRDNTAISVAEVSQRDTGKVRYGEKPRPARYDAESGHWLPAQDIESVLITEYTIRHIRRLPLGMSYPAVALHIADMICSPLFFNRDVRLLIDVTGVGRPVYDDIDEEIWLRYGMRNADGTFLKQKGEQMKSLLLKPITFSSGQKYNRSTGVLAKAFLVSRLQTLLQSERVHGPDTPEMAATIEELKIFEIKVSDDGKDQYGAFQTGKHDDLAVALGLSTLEDPFSERVSYSKRVY